MPGSVLPRLGGVCAIIGGALNLASSVVHFGGPTRAAVPVSVLCLLVGVVGLHARLRGREGRWGAIGFALAAVGVTLGIVGMAGSALGVVGSGAAARVINSGEHAGLVFIGAGMLAWGTATLKHRALGRWSFTPMMIAVSGLAGITFVQPAAFAVIENGFLPVVFGGSWILLGVALLAPVSPRLTEVRERA